MVIDYLSIQGNVPHVDGVPMNETADSLAHVAGCNETAMLDMFSGYKMKFVESVYWLALNIYHEARGEPLQGKIAVAHVTISRATKRRMAVKAVVTQPHQFSWYSDSKPDDITDHDAFIQCIEASLAAMDQRLQGDTMGGADHYHATSVNPTWNRNMKVIAKIGNHIFYKA